MFGGGSSSGGRGRDTRIHRLRQVAGGSAYTPNHQQQQQQQSHLMNMNMLLQQQQSLPMSPYQPQLLSPSTTSHGCGVDVDDDFPKRDERVLQWGRQETRDLIGIRSELEAEFCVAKRKKGLWETVVAKMKHLGYSRTPDQCKCKWKNLLVRYKGKEASDSDNGQQFPFYEEMHEIFMRSNHMPRSCIHDDPEAGSVQSGKRVRKVNADETSGEFIDNQEDDYASDEDRIPENKKIQKVKRIRMLPSSKYPTEPIATTNVSNTGSTLTAIHEIVQGFFRQQLQIDARWRETTENSAQERSLFELDWRQMKEKLERERIMQEQEWREREEQRKVREETRAEKLDALLTILLKKLVQENEN